MAGRDYYQVLGVARGATTDEIKAAYRRLALRYHPDKNPGDQHAEELFKDATEAYNVLSDPGQRRRYDLRGAFGGQAPSGAADAGAVFEDIFAQIFSAARRRGATRGEDIEYQLRVPFEQAARGGEGRITIERRERCGACSGTGARPGSSPALCHACGGSGRLSLQRGLFTASRECGYCRGSGRVVAERDRCSSCAGAGQLRREVTVLVTVPAGADDGTVVRYRGEGQAGEHGAPPGDLLVTLRVEPHQLFTRQGDDIACELPVTFVQAALGTQLEVPTLTGPVSMRVPPGTQSGAVFRLRGKGVTRLHRGGQGDQLVTVRVEVPRELSDEQRQLLLRFAELAGDEVHPQQRTFWEKVRELFA